jgi:hypothetical protein
MHEDFSYDANANISGNAGEMTKLEFERRLLSAEGKAKRAEMELRNEMQLKKLIEEQLNLTLS